MLDANGDGKLTKDEVKAAEKFLATRDADEDECLSMQEFAPGVYDQNRVRRLGEEQLLQSPNGNPYPVPVGAQTVVIYETGKVPGTVTQQVIKKYDKDNDFELTKTECGFDDLTFKALDRDGNGNLDGEELDAWRTGVPDLSVSLSLAPKQGDCVAKLDDEKGAAARGFVLKQTEAGRLVLHVGRQAIDFSAFATNFQNQQGSLKQSFAYLFTQAAGGKDHIVEKDLAGPNAVQFQIVRVMFETADRDADGKMTKAEFDAYFDLQDNFRNVSLSLTPAVQTPTLFQLLDESRDGRLSVRELRTAWDAAGGAGVAGRRSHHEEHHPAGGRTAAVAHVRPRVRRATGGVLREPEPGAGADEGPGVVPEDGPQRGRRRVAHRVRRHEGRVRRDRHRRGRPHQPVGSGSVRQEDARQVIGIAWMLLRVGVQNSVFSRLRLRGH